MGTQADLRGCFTTRSFNKNRPFLRFCSVIRRAARLSKLDSASSQSVGSRLKELGARSSLSYTICSSLLLDLTHKLVRNIIVVAGFFFFLQQLLSNCSVIPAQRCLAFRCVNVTTRAGLIFTR